MTVHLCHKVTHTVHQRAKYASACISMHICISLHLFRIPSCHQGASDETTGLHINLMVVSGPCKRIMEFQDPITQVRQWTCVSSYCSTFEGPQTRASKVGSPRMLAHNQGHIQHRLHMSTTKDIQTTSYKGKFNYNDTM